MKILQRIQDGCANLWHALTYKNRRLLELMVVGEPVTARVLRDRYELEYGGSIALVTVYYAFIHLEEQHLVSIRNHEGGERHMRDATRLPAC